MADRLDSIKIPIDRALATLGDYCGDPNGAAHVFDQSRDFISQHHRSVFWGDRLLTLDKTAGFRDDVAFRHAISSASSSTGANQYASPDGITWRFNTLIWAAQQALSVPGDFVECGVYEGDMSWVMTEMVDLAVAGRQLHLFDTFDGFARRYSSPEDFPDCPEFFDVIDADYRRPEIYDFVQRRFAAKPYVTIHKGPVPDTLDAAPPRIAFLHLDMNSPAPERAALEQLYDRVSPGGVIVFDDYGWVIHKKQKIAADEFMATKSLSVMELPTGQGLVMKPPR